MKNVRIAFVTATLLAAAAVVAQVNMPSPQAPGNSMESAVRVIAASDFMVERFIKRWLRTHYPNWDADPHEYMEFGDERYAVVFIRSSENPSRRVYFRVQSRPGEDVDDRNIPFPSL
jgi:hypothetical protein